MIRIPQLQYVAPKAPTLTPVQAQARLIAEGPFTHQGFTYFDASAWGPPEVAAYPDEVEIYDVEVHGSFFPKGEPGEPITENTPWIQCP